MRRGQGLFTTLLMLIPMTAVPIMAIFGIPQFVTVSASPFARNRTTATPEYRETRVGQSDALLVRPVTSTNGHTAETLDLFQPYRNPDWQSRRKSEGSPGTAGAGNSGLGLQQRRLVWTDPLQMNHQNSLPSDRGPVIHDNGSNADNVSSPHRPKAAPYTEVSQRVRVNATESVLTGHASVPAESGHSTQTPGVQTVQGHQPHQSQLGPVATQRVTSGRTSPGRIRRASFTENSTDHISDLQLPEGSKPQEVKTASSTNSRYSRQRRDGRSTVTRPTSVHHRTLTWKQAVQRLNALGIRTFRLTPDSTETGYRFVSLVTSVEDPRVSRRFEAESPDPLVAVQLVIAQVEDWNAQR